MLADLIRIVPSSGLKKFSFGQMVSTRTSNLSESKGRYSAVRPSKSGR